MDEATKKRFKSIVVEIEGCKNKVYQDIYGNITIGIGHNLTANPVSDAIINQWFDEDVAFAEDLLNKTFHWFPLLSVDRKMAITYMAFNLGWKKFLTFKRMLNALYNSDFETAANEILDSRYYSQVPRGAGAVYDGIRHNQFKVPE